MAVNDVAERFTRIVTAWVARVCLMPLWEAKPSLPG